jgi:outer membrane protein assembly factor BamB
MPALAVVPGLMGPLQAVVAMLPQLFAVFFGLFGSLLSMSYWREKARQHVKLLALLGLGAVALLWGTADHRQPVVATATPRPALSHQSWLSFRGDLAGGGVGVLGSEPFSLKPTTRWMNLAKADNLYLSSPVAINQRVYVGVATLTKTRAVGSLECFDAKDGKLIWRSLTPHPVFASPVAANGRVFCGEGLHENNDCKMYCLDAASGKTVWTVTTRGHTEGTPSLHQGRLIFSAGGDGFYCVEEETGKELWHNRCGHCDSSAAVGQGRVFVGTAYGDNAAVCLDLQSGKSLWKKSQSLPVWGHPSLVGSRVYFGLGNGTFGEGAAKPAGAVICLQASNGASVWRHNLPDSVNTSLSVVGEDLFCGCRDGNVYCLSLRDGRQRWKAFCGNPVLASLVIQGDSVLVAGGDGRLHALDRANGQERWSYLVSDVPCESSPMLNGGLLYLAGGSSVMCLGQ